MNFILFFTILSGFFSVFFLGEILFLLHTERAEYFFRIESFIEYTKRMGRDPVRKILFPYVVGFIICLVIFVVSYL